MSQPDFEAVVRRVKADDRSGADKLYRLLNSGLRLLIARWLVRQDVDDQVHETLLIVIDAIQKGQLHDPKRLLGYVRAVAKKVIAETMEARVRQPAPGVAQELEGTPGSGAVDQQDLALMQRVLAVLSRREREVLARYYVRGQSQEQILAEMKITARQFESCRSKAKARFALLGGRMRASTGPLHGIRLRLAHALR